MKGASRITFVSPHAVLGGAEAVMRTVLLALGREEVAGVVVLQDGPLVGRLRADGFVVDVVPAGRRLGMLPAARRLRTVIARQGAGVVHANGIKAALVCRLGGPGGPPVLWMKHDAAGDPWLSRLVALGCADVVGVSAAAMAPLARRRRAQTVIHNGLPDRAVDRAAGRRVALAAAGLPPAAPNGPVTAAGGPELVGLAGRLAVGKGQHELLAALPAILAARPPVRVLMIGGEDPAFPGLGAELRAAAGPFGERVVFTGHRADVPELLSGCDLVVAPSIRDPGGWREGFGLAVAEAMQAGTPVVAYASGSLPEVIGDAGLVVPEGDRDALAAAVVHVLGDERLRADLARRGVERVAANFRLTDSLTALQDRYTALADTTPGADP